MVGQHIRLKMTLAALSLGLLEAAWTRPEFGGPRDALLGCAAILAVLVIIGAKRFWWIPALAIFEEATQGYVGTLGAWHPTLDTVLNHWSAGVVGVNFYPWVTFPLLTLAGELAYQVIVKKHPDSKLARILDSTSGRAP